MSSSKKYFLVKDEDNQEGGYYPFKVVQVNPLVLGPPIIRLTPVISSNMVSSLKIESSVYSFLIEVPYKILRPLIDSIYHFERLNPSFVKDVKVTITTPILKSSLRTSHEIILKVLDHIKTNYKPLPNFKDVHGKQIQLMILLNQLKNIVKKNITIAQTSPSRGIVNYPLTYLRR